MRVENKRQQIDQVVVNKRQIYDNSGADLRIFDLVEGHEIERIMIRFDHNDEVPHKLSVYDEVGGEPSETMMFEDNRLQFSPISAIGDPGREKLYGVTAKQNRYQDIPPVVGEVWKALGYTVVPTGTEWLL